MDNIDLPLLKDQKQTLLTVMDYLDSLKTDFGFSTPFEMEHLEGILSLMDSIQDDLEK